MHSRHDLVWLTESGWNAAIARAPATQHAALHQWRVYDWPAIVRRRDEGVAAVCLGIPLPFASGTRQRVSLVVDAGDVARSTAPLPLADALAAAPPQWLAALVTLQRAFAAFDLRVYGSLAMQSLTSLPYLRAASDIDLLLQPRTRCELDAGVALLARHAETLPLDGEIVFPGGAAVAWKEWQADRARVLVKTLDSVQLVDAGALAATLPA